MPPNGEHGWDGSALIDYNPLRERFMIAYESFLRAVSRGRLKAEDANEYILDVLSEPGMPDPSVN